MTVFAPALPLRDPVRMDRRAADDPAVPGLVAAARAGSAAAFGELVAIHERIAIRTAMAALHSRADAEDAVQEAFVLAWRRLGTFRGDAQFRTWLLSIVWRRALDRRRARQRWWRIAARTPGDAAEPPGWLVVDAAPDPEGLLLAQDLARRIRQAIARLPARLADTLLLAASGEHSYDEIARLLGVRHGTIKWRVAEARRLIRRCLDEQERR